MKLGYCYLLKRAIEVMQKKNCYGCQIDHPSQKQHLDGCLLDPEAAVERYTDVAVLEVLPENIEKLITRLLEFAGQPAEAAVAELAQDICGVGSPAYENIKEDILKESKLEKLIADMAEMMK
jgi:DNA-directed RNA polymerase subunit L